MKLRFTPRAARDLTDIAEYLRARNPAAAERVRAAILETLHRTARFPDLGRRQDVPGVRKLVTRRYRYLVYYVVDAEADEIVVLTIQHAAREREQRDI